jgi:HK97 family phage portal protein
MSIFDRFASLLPRTQPLPARAEPTIAAPKAAAKSQNDTSPDAWYRRYGGGMRSSTGIVVTKMAALQVSALLTCVTIIAEDVAKLPIHVYRRGPAGEKIIATDHPLEKLLRRPHRHQTRFEFFEMIIASLILRGNAYAVILRDWRGRPEGMIAVTADDVTMHQSPSGEIFYSVNRRNQYMMVVLSRFSQLIHSDDILHIRWLSEDGLSGLNRLGLAREIIGLALAQQRQAGLFAKRGARPSGWLEMPAGAAELSDAAYRRMQIDWDDEQAGLENVGRTPILEQGVKFHPELLKSVDMEFLAARKHQEEQIARILRIPLHKLNMGDGKSAANMVQADQDYQNSVVSSYCERIECKINDTFDLQEEDLFVEFDIERFLRADIQTRFTAYRTGVLGMFLTPNEVRRKEGLPAEEHGDTLYQPTNVAPIGFKPKGNETGPGSDVSGSPAPGGDGDPAAVPTAEE